MRQLARRNEDSKAYRRDCLLKVEVTVLERCVDQRHSDRRTQRGRKSEASGRGIHADQWIVPPPTSAGIGLNGWTWACSFSSDRYRLRSGL